MLDRTNLTGRDFEFLIIHPDELEINGDIFDKLMTPDNISWTKISKDNWYYYVVGQDEFTYSWEPPGIQMTFNDDIIYDKAKDIAEQVVTKLKNFSGLDIDLVFIDKQQLIKFE